MHGLIWERPEPRLIFLPFPSDASDVKRRLSWVHFRAGRNHVNDADLPRWRRRSVVGGVEASNAWSTPLADQDSMAERGDLVHDSSLLPKSRRRRTSFSASATPCPKLSAPLHVFQTSSLPFDDNDSNTQPVTNYFEIERT
jgi:hypothetical protein